MEVREQETDGRSLSAPVRERRPALHAAWRYGLAVASALVAWRTTVLIWPWVQPNIAPLFFAAVIVTAWFGGLGPAAVCTALCGGLSTYGIPGAEGSDAFDAGDALRVATLLMAGGLVSWLNYARQEAQRALAASRRLQSGMEEQRQQLEATNERLREEIAQRQRAQEESQLHQAKLRKLSAELSIAEERERREIASQLHDGVGQQLAFVQMRLESLSASSDGELLRGELEQALGQLRLAIGQTRSLTRELSPPVLYEAGLERALEWLADRVRAQHGLPVSVTRRGSEAQLGRELRLFLFQAVRELLTNAVKHAGAREANVTLFNQGAFIRVVVEDDGKGFAEGAELAEPEGDGFGLLNVRERAMYLGGQLEIESEPGRGSRVMLTVPLNGDGGRDAG